MAKVRRPGAGLQRPTQPTGGLQAALESALLKSGLAKTPAEAKKMAKAMLAALTKLGVPVKGKELGAALKAFQEAQGLPTSGKLDPATQGALEQLGVFGRPKAEELPELAPGNFGMPSAGDAFSGDAKKLTRAAARTTLASSAQAETQSPRPGVPVEKGHSVEARQAAERNKLTEPTKAENLKQLQNALAEAGHPGAGKGKAQLESALSSFQDAHGLPQTGLPDEATVQALAQLELERGGEFGDLEDERGNASSGDDDETELDRGHAQNKEGEHETGYYEIPPLAKQIRAALDEISRDESVSGPVTYSWDVTFYRPGTYGAGQKAEPLWHLAVEEVSPFDPVWDEAREKLSERLAELEPDATPPTLDEFTLALRRARFN